jgi:hypothetical protein
MTPYNGDITQSLKWMQNKAPNIQSLINQKSAWYTQFHTQFWNNWQENVFSLQTANSFGLMVWCIILGVPSQLFGLYPANASWAFGPYRQNYVYTGTQEAFDPITDPNLQGGNFYGGGSTTVLNLNEVKWALQLRYATLVSNGRVSFINRMLSFIFNGGNPWTAAQYAAGLYFYVADSTISGNDPSGNPVSIPANPSYLEYRIGPNLGISPQFIDLLNSPQYGIIPCGAGSRYLVVQES